MALYFSLLAGHCNRDLFAADRLHSHLIACFRALFRPSAKRREEARKCSTIGGSFSATCAREQVSAEFPLRPVYLCMRVFGGHTREANGVVISSASWMRPRFARY